MEEKDFVAVVVSIHNRLTEINVRGDDAIRMADVLRFCRNVAAELQSSKSQTE